VIAPAIQCFDSPESCTANRYSEGDPYEFTRTPTGWTTSTLAPPASEYESSSWFSVNANAGTALFTAPSSPEGLVDDFLARGEHSLTNVGPVGEHEVGGLPPNWKAIRLGNVIATANLTYFVYETTGSVWSFDNGPSAKEAGALYEYAPEVAGTPLMVGVAGGYENGENHNLISTCGTWLGQGHGATARGFDGSLSEDGRIVYFTAVAREAGGRTCRPADELYARIDGEDDEPGLARSVPISEDPPASTCQTTPCKEDTTIPGNFRDAYFEGASSDGSDVVFTSTQQLTDGASEDSGSAAGHSCHELAPSGGGCNLYLSQCPHCEALSEAEEEEDGARSLVDVSEDAAGGQVAGGPRVQGVLAVSPDGSHVYFVAKGVLTGAEENANHERAENEAQNLYLYAEGRRTFIARLSSQPEILGSVDESEWSDINLVANVTPEGRFLVFTSSRALTPDDTREEGPAQVYEYDSRVGSLTRVSIGEDGYNNDGNSGAGNAQIAEAGREAASDGSVPYRMDPTMSNNGSYVFFQSPIALTPGALDDIPAPDELGQKTRDEGLVQNVYEYHDGRVSLISDGKDVTDTGGIGLQDIISPVELLGSDESGANVFFATFSPLVPRDTDTQRDIYDARSNECVNVRGEEGTPSEGSCAAGEHLELSGFPAPVSSSLCEEACHAAGSGSVSEGVPASESFVGAGNLTPPAPAAPVVVKPKTAAQVRAEKLAKALKVCRKDKKKSKRTSCEKRARKAYGAAATAKKRVVSK
jgi:hypothetical protein